MPIYLLNEKLIFPNPENSDSSGLIAVGGDLSIERLLLAYRKGIFPWYSEGDPILWFSPDPRLIFYPSQFTPSKSLQKVIKTSKFDVKFDQSFETIIKNCAEVNRIGQTGTWITEGMIDSYIKLHEEGYAHSVETYFESELVGGLYGVSLGGAFFGESMFHKVSNASKVAFYYLMKKCKKWNFDFIDSQVSTDHMKAMGAKEISRTEFLKILSKTLDKETKKGKWNHL